MRELVQSRVIVGLIIGFHVLATLSAIPVPSFSFSKQAGWAETHASYCSCTSCSPTNCCCAMLAPESSDEDDSGVAMFGYSCQPTLSWLIIALPPVTSGAEPTGEMVPGLADRGVVMSHTETGVLSLGVPTPPATEPPADGSGRAKRCSNQRLKASGYEHPSARSTCVPQPP